MNMRVILPLGLFLLVVVLLWRGLYLRPAEVPSPLVNKAIPEFELPTLHYPSKVISNKDFVGHITLLNVFASWCRMCEEEHNFLLELAKIEYLTLYGLNYKDDEAKALKWLQENGNPYKVVGVDKDGLVAIDWGVYGTPETFLIDKKGVIRYKLVGPLTKYIWDHNFQPLIDEMRKEG